MAHSELIDTLADLIRINSVNPAYDPAHSESEVQKFVLSFFASQGIEVWEQPVFPGRPNVIARLEGRNSSRRIVFEAHCDTAGVERMVIPPFDPRIKNGRVYGRPCEVPFGSDASKLSRAGIPSIILGPGSIEQAHTVHEFVEIEQVEKAFVAYQRLMRVFE